MRSLLLAGCLTLLVAAPAPAIEEHKDLKDYGNCAVTTQVDLLTDEESPSFLCAEFPDITKSFGITKVPNRPFIISLRAGIQFHPSDSIPIAIRVYPGPVIRREARWIEDAAYLVDSQLAESLLYQIIDAQMLVIEVGTQRATIDLAGSAQAVRDFRMRLSTSQQSLDIPSSP